MSNSKIVMASDGFKSRYISLAERKEAAKQRLEQQYQKEVAEWLKEKPHVGALNSGKFYKFVDGEMVSVKPLDPKA